LKIGAAGAAPERVEAVFSETCGKLLKFLSATGKEIFRAGQGIREAGAGIYRSGREVAFAIDQRAGTALSSALRWS